MKIFASIILFISLTAGIAFAQCSQASVGTNCNSPMTVSGSTASQSSVGLTDNGAAPPQPAPSQYWLSISNGTLRLSANGQPYALPGMPTNYELLGQAGGAYSKDILSGATVSTPVLNQIDMTLPRQIRLVVSVGMSCVQCSIQAQYYNGSAWNNLTDPLVPLYDNTPFATGWTSIPTEANGDHPVRLVLSNSDSTDDTVSMHSAMLQFK